MNEPIKYKRLIELASELNEKLDELSIGKLSRQELESLTEHSRELYERLVVLRYKSYDLESKGKQETPPVESPMPFRISDTKAETVPVNQVSLIDAIEEVSQADKSTEPVTPPRVQPTPPKPAIQASPQEMNSPGPESLHEKLTRNMDVKETIAQKLETAPISDLKKAISLNQRFQFSKELFRGNNQEYEMAIDRLNSSPKGDAMKFLDVLMIKYSWNQESPVAMDFMELIERRHG